MKKRLQRCKFVRRFAASVAALMMCVALCVPCFASNNASTKKWVVVEEDQRRGENGVLTKYFKLSPYSNGALYASLFESHYYSVPSSLKEDGYDIWCLPVNYPDWWRADIPLGRTAYVEFSSINILGYNTPDGSRPSSFQFLPVNKAYSYDVTFSKYSSGSSFTQRSAFYPLYVWTSLSSSSLAYDYAWGFSYSGSSPVIGPLSDKTQLIYAPVQIGGFDFYDYDLFSNVSSSQLAWIVSPGFSSSTPAMNNCYLKVSAVLSYWVDANKLPAGLQVGDEFPADTDAFDQLRDDLIEQFPEASDNIENGKSTLTGWNDTQTVGEDVASSSLGVLNGLFQNLGQFLFVVSLMVFGAVVLRMFIKKAVS